MRLNSDTTHSKLSNSQSRAIRRGGRSNRLAARQNPEGMVRGNRQLRNIPAYALLSDDALSEIEQQAEWIASEIGVEFRGDNDAIDLFRKAGASIEGERVRFDPGHLRALCSTAPAQYDMHGRDGVKDFTLGGDHLVLMPGYGSPFVTDLDGGRRYATLEDFRNFVKLTYLSPWLHHAGGNGLRTGGCAGQQTPSRYGLRASALFQQTIHGCCHVARACARLAGPRRTGLRRPLSRRPRGDPGQYQCQFTAGFRPHHVRSPCEPMPPPIRVSPYPQRYSAAQWAR